MGSVLIMWSPIMHTDIPTSTNRHPELRDPAPARAGAGRQGIQLAGDHMIKTTPLFIFNFTDTKQIKESHQRDRKKKNKINKSMSS